MQEQTGLIAGAIWEALNTKGELTLGKLKEAVKAPAPVFDWAIGWLAREDKIVITRKQRSFSVRLKQTQADSAAHAA
jgi:Winged helix-turn-helix domain (DUF2582)